jgi:hypothetical protein
MGAQNTLHAQKSLICLAKVVPVSQPTPFVFSGKDRRSPGVPLTSGRRSHTTVYNGAEQLDSPVLDHWFRLKEFVFSRSDCGDEQRIQYVKNRYQQKAWPPGPGTEFSDAIEDLRGASRSNSNAPR